MSSGDLPLAPSSPPPPHSTCEISDLSDEDLAEIFKYLQPSERFLVAAVCKRWWGISKASWLDVSHLDLSPIPGPNIAAIIKKCPNLKTVFAARKAFGLDELKILSQIPLVSVKLHHCNIAVSVAGLDDAFSGVFSDELWSAAWDEFVLRDAQLIFQIPDAGGEWATEVGFPASLPAALKRLHLSNLLSRSDRWPFSAASAALFDGLESFQALECLMLHETLPPDLFAADKPISKALYRISEKIGALSNLRELFLGSNIPPGPNLVHLSGLRRLETLFLFNVWCYWDDVAALSLIQLICEHTTLRILVLTGRIRVDAPIQLPDRVRFPSGLGGLPAPLLHIFVGGEASTKLLFPTPFEAALVYPIDEPLPQFLDREDIRPIFDGVWIAAQSKKPRALAPAFPRRNWFIRDSDGSLLRKSCS